ncbi:hypothetical protein ID866_5792 [Astraeus odoratus]|nr:hypothetical protein ID866_5792 [Astraeus odoratus]
MVDTSDIESAPTPSIKSLKSRFEQLARENATATTFSQPVTLTQGPASSQTLLSPDVPVRRPRASVGTDERSSHSSVRTLRPSTSSSDIQVAAKRAPPPPPPARGKKPISSPAVSPLLRPVPVPAILRSPGASPEQRVKSTMQGDEHGDDDTPVPGNVASLRSRLSSSALALPSSRPTTPKPVPRLGALTSYSDPSVHENSPPPIPTRCPRSDHSQSPSSTMFESPGDISEPDGSVRPSSVAALRERFVSLNALTPYTPKAPPRDDHPASQSEPNILSPSHPPTLPPRRPPPPPRPPAPSTALFQTDDNADLPGSSNSSVYSPFSEDEPELSDIASAFVTPPAIPPRKTSSSPGALNGGRHERKLSDVSSSSEGFTPPSKPKPPPRPGVPIPPRPPPRHNGVSNDISTNPISAVPVPPPLPTRRVSPDDRASETYSFAPPLPARHCVGVATTNSFSETVATSPICEKKSLCNSKLPPPPTRQIALGDKLPPVRRALSASSDEDSGDDEDPRARIADALPDSSRSSRRPPAAEGLGYSEARIHVPAYSGQVAVASPSVVVATHHHIRHYDLSYSESPLWTVDTREMGLREAKVTCLEFRPASEAGDRGQFVWFGTKEGHLFEMDVRTGSLTATKFSAHSCQVTHMFRHGRTMITADDSGKVMIFDPDAGASDDVSLVYTQPRVYRIAEKQDFVKMLGGLLWTSVRTDTNGAGTASVPVIRIYDPFAPGSVARPVVPTQHVGAVTAGTLLPAHPDHVYLGHEGGFISVWDIATQDGTPTCVDVMKVSASDVLCLEGVSSLLWAGGRKGTISAYDVTSRPWTVTNCWDAHDGLPVLKLFVDPYSIEKVARLCVASIGRDEHIRFWDGLLGRDWIDQELLKRERAFSTFRDISVLIVSWNVDAAKPDALTGDPENTNFFHNVFQSVESPDVIVFGFQEVIDLENRKMAAKTVLLGGKKKGEEGKISEKVTSSYKRWHDRLVLAVKLAMPPESPYTVVHTENLVGLFTCMFVKNAERLSLTDAAITTIKRGMGGRYGNKGAIVARLVVDDSSICFINCHLAAGQNHVRQRNADVAAVLEEKSVFPTSCTEEEVLAYVGGGDGSMVLDHEIVFINGDMNYRIDQRRDPVISVIQSGELEPLLVHDQLLKEMKYNRGFRLRSFQEGPLTFPPTYKYDRRSNEFDTSEQRRTPAWCDRILWRSHDPERIVQLNYRRYEANVSDHRPISASFVVTVKSVRHDARAREKLQVEAQWMDLQATLLASARDFYADLALA